MAITDTKEQIITKRGYRASVHGDQYALYLSNYPIAAKYLSSRLKGDMLLELCCALGITLEALSNNFKKLIGVDIDPKVLEDCRQNLKDSGFLNKIELVQGDISNKDLLKSFKADVVIYDIPYWVSKELPDGTNVLDRNPDLKLVVQTIREYITQNIVIFAPPYMEYENIKEQLGECEYERIYINGRYDRNYIYFGDLVRNNGVTKKELNY